MDIAKKVGERIRYYRHKGKISIDILAEQINFISAFKDTYKMTPQECRKLHAAYKEFL